MIRQTPGSSALLHLAFSFALVIALAGVARAQTGSKPYARKNAFGALVAYSNDSSHIILGDAERRKLLDIGVSYSRRLLLTHFLDWQYDAELLPVALEGDPLTQTVVQQTQPTQTTFKGNGGPPITCGVLAEPYMYTGANGVVYSGTISSFCHSRQWTIGESMSPVGFQWNFRPRSRIQPIFEGHGGYMYTTRPVPVFAAGSFNFTFDFGAGIEYFQSHSRSIRVEYRYHHISNHNTADQNPGIDSGLFQLSYVFGR